MTADEVSDDEHPARTVVATDTSALMMPVECDVRLFEELDRLLTVGELVAPRPVMDELDKLSRGNGAEGTAASVGAQLAADRCRVVECEESYADDAIVEIATNGDVDYVVTNDRELRDRVLAENVPVIGLRARNKLAVTQP